MILNQQTGRKTSIELINQLMTHYGLDGDFYSIQYPKRGNNVPLADELADDYHKLKKWHEEFEEEYEKGGNCDPDKMMDLIRQYLERKRDMEFTKTFFKSPFK